MADNCKETFAAIAEEVTASWYSMECPDHLSCQNCPYDRKCTALLNFLRELKAGVSNERID